jgi:serine-type D-Ala-D-Ala carboxypeptidase/endopeptidase (penicillin-binding protein 4)
MAGKGTSAGIITVVGIFVAAGLVLIDFLKPGKAQKIDIPVAVTTPEPDTLVKDSVPPLTPFEKLTLTLDSIVNSPDMVNGGFGFCLKDPETGEIILERGSKKSLVPASVLKIFSTGTALALLGSGYHFNTRLMYDGKIENGVLNGNIYILGGGDPSLGSNVFGSTAPGRVLGQWLNAVKSLGIDSIAGAVLGDGEMFEYDMIPAGWAWEDIQNDYGTGMSGLSFRENWYTINARTSGGKCQISCEPQMPFMTLYNKVICNPSVYKSYIYVNGGPYSLERTALGEVSGEFSCVSPVPDPPLLASYSLWREIKRAGIAVKDSFNTVRKMKLTGTYQKKERKMFHSMVSPSLTQLVRHTNFVSQNFYAESILRVLGLERSGYGSTISGVNSVMSFCKSRGMDMRGFFMTDGSGVSRFDAITAEQLASFLTIMYQDSLTYPNFYSSLPVAGKSGTLKNVGDSTIASGKIRAKSGYMTRVRSYAGYVTITTGKVLAFGMISNNALMEPVAIRNKMEQLMVLMAGLDSSFANKPLQKGHDSFP